MITYLESDEATKGIEEFATKMANAQKTKKRQLKQFHERNKNENDFRTFVEKVLQKYETKEYIMRYLNQGIEPPKSLTFFLLEYAAKYGRKATKAEWKKYSNPFTGELYYIHGYYFNLMHGQGSVVKIIKEEL